MQGSSFIIYIGLYIIAGSILTAIISHIWVNRKLLHVGYSVPLLCALWLWFSFQLLEYIFPGKQLKILFNLLQYLGISLLPAAWLFFCFKNATKRRPLPFLSGLIFSILSVLCLGFILTNQYHHFIWRNTRLHPDQIHVLKDFRWGFVLVMLYTWGCIAWGFWLLAKCIMTATQYVKRQTLILTIAALFSFLTMALDFLIMEKHSYLVISPILFSYSSLIVFYFARLRYFKTIPLSQHIVIESMHDLCIILNPDNQIIYCNPPVYHNFMLSPSGVIGKSIVHIFRNLQPLVESDSRNQSGNHEVIIANHNYDVNISHIFNWQGRMINRVLMLRNITRLKETEETLRQMTDHLEALVTERTRELRQTNEALLAEINERRKTEARLHISLEEKNILLGEIHHRVKNNLQVIISMLSLQKKYLNDNKSVSSFNTAISRIKSIAIIHEKLYKSEDLANTDLAEYIKDLARYLLEYHKSADKKIFLEVMVDEIYLDLDKSILCGLIINELVLNAIKHAFPAGWTTPVQPALREYRIWIYFQKEKSKYCFGVRDNGSGLPADLELEKVDSLGMKIIRTLARQLSGTVEIIRGMGTEIRICF